MRRRIMFLLVMVMLGTTLTGCGNKGELNSAQGVEGGDSTKESEAAVSEEDTGMAEGANVQETYEIWVCDKSAVHQYHRTLKLGCEAAAEELGVNLTYDAPAVSGDAAAQLDMFETAIAAKPDAICIGVIDQEACVAGMEKAQSAGIPIFCYDNGVNSDIPVTTLATNDLEATHTLAEKIGEELGGEGSILIVGHDQTSKNGQERTNGLIDALAELYPDIEVLDVQYSNDAAVVTKIAKSMMTTYSDADVIYGTCDNVVNGILNAVAELGMEGKIKVIGYDSGKQQTDAVRNGMVFGSITQAPYSQGYDIVKYAVDYLNGAEIPKEIDATYYFYNAENIEDPDVAQCLYD